MTSRHRWRGRLTLALTILMCAALSACGLRGGDAPRQISVLTIQDPFFFGLQKLLPQFEKETGIKVKMEGVDYNTLNARSTNSFLTHQSDIDVISPDSMWLSRFANSGWLVDLSPLMRRDRAEVRPDDFIPGAIHSLSEWKGGIYTLPAAAYGSVVLYRPDVFKALGLPMPPAKPSPDWTWDKYLQEVKAIDGKTVNGQRMHGTVVAGSGPQPVLHMYSQLAASKGVRWFQSFPDSPKWNFTPQLDSAENLDALRYFQQLYRYSPPESINYLWFDAGTAFSSGNVGMFYWWTPYAYLVRKSTYMGTKDSKVVGKYAVAALPQQPGKEQVSNVGGYAFGISRYSEKKSAAWKFVKWASSARTQKQMALLPGHQFADFARRSLYSDPQLLKAYDYLPTQLSVLEKGDGKAARPPIPNYTTLEGDYGQALNQMLAGDLTPQQTAEQVQANVKDVLQNEQYLPWRQPSYDDTVASTTRILQQLGRPE
jgi:multiple sugar transport system substrate-binding protein